VRGVGNTVAVGGCIIWIRTVKKNDQILRLVVGLIFETSQGISLLQKDRPVQSVQQALGIVIAQFVVKVKDG
jgi:hypothetical protein